LVEHEPILIQSNADFLKYDFEGTGEESDPYIIENYMINSFGEFSYGIDIRGTNRYFIIRNCYVYADYIGIGLYMVSGGRSIIKNNTCVSRTNDGGGIGLGSMGSCLIANNTCINFMQGIHLNNVDLCTITNNSIKDNNYQGINIRYSDSNTITNNRIINTVQHGLAIVGSSRSNIIHHNFFINNSNSESYSIDGEYKGVPTSQAYDEGSNNMWYDEENQYGNYWSDYTGEGDYVIDGSAETTDRYPRPSSENLIDPLTIIVFGVSITAIIAVGIIFSVFLIKKYLVKKKD
jgi:parallel beta-helix repeat protein